MLGLSLWPMLDQLMRGGELLLVCCMMVVNAVWDHVIVC